MNPKTHQKEEAFDKLCREIVNAAQASEEEIHAAANAPFLYQRLQAQIAAEQLPIVAIKPLRNAKSNFVAAIDAFATLWRVGRWAVAATAIALIVWGGWQMRQPTASQIAKEQPTPSPFVTASITPEIAPMNPIRNTEERAVQSLPITNKIKATKPVRNQPMRVVSRVLDDIEEAEIATEFLPLTYTAQSDEQQRQIVRMEMPRSMLASLGVPLANITGDRVKADVMMSDDGVALAIRLIQPQ